MRLSSNMDPATNNFDPNAKKEYTLPDPGVYKARIENAEIKTSAKGINYLSTRLKLTDGENNTVGTVFDNVHINSENGYMQQIVGMFCSALGCSFEGQEIDDYQFASMCEKQDLVVRIEKDFYEKNGEKIEKRVVGKGQYYPIYKYDELVAAASPSGLTDIANNFDDPFAGLV